MEEENFEPFFKDGDVNEENEFARKMKYVSNLEAARDYLDIAKEHTSRLTKIATRTPKSIMEMEIPRVQPYSQFDKTKNTKSSTRTPLPQYSGTKKSSSLYFLKSRAVETTSSRTIYSTTATWD